MRNLIKYEHYNRIIEKSEVKYSQTALNYVKGLFDEYDRICARNYNNQSFLKKNFFPDSHKTIIEKRNEILRWMGFLKNSRGYYSIPFKVPIKEIIYESPKINLGLMLYGIYQSFTSEVKENESEMKKKIYDNSKIIFKEWLDKKTIHSLGDTIITEVKEKGIIECELEIGNDTSGGRYNDIGKIINVSKLGKIYNDNFIDKLFGIFDHSETTMRHELQHLTQNFNSEMIRLAKMFQSGYGKILSEFQSLEWSEILNIYSSVYRDSNGPKILKKIKWKKDFETLKMEDPNFVHNTIFFSMIDDAKFDHQLSKDLYVGIGKTKTDYNFRNSASVNPNLRKNLNFFQKLGHDLSFILTKALSTPIGKSGLNYFGDDVEYQTWLSDTLDNYTKIEPHLTTIKNNSVDAAYEIISKKMKSSKHYKLMKKIRKEAENDFLKLLKERIKNMKKK